MTPPTAGTREGDETAIGMHLQAQAYIMDISRDLSHRHPLVMIRFNRDGYVCPEKGKIPSPWAYNKNGLCTVRPK